MSNEKNIKEITFDENHGFHDFRAYLFSLQGLRV